MKSIGKAGKLKLTTVKLKSTLKARELNLLMAGLLRCLLL